MVARTVFMYSGQGSQYFHMTGELYRHHPRYRLWMDHCDEIAEPILGRSVIDLLLDPDRRRSDPFDAFPQSSAALLCVEYSLTRVVQEMGHRPHALLGYSLGEIVAAVVAQALSLEDGLRFAVEFGRLLIEQTPRCTMLAVVAPVELLTTRAGWFEQCWVTGRNTSENFVVSGRPGPVNELRERLDREGILHQVLPVLLGVHTPLVDPVEGAVRDLLGTVTFSRPQIPLVSCSSAAQVRDVTVESVWQALRRPVEFRRTINTLALEADRVFVDLGPSATLATFVKYILPPNSGSTQLATVNRFGNDLRSLEEFDRRAARQPAEPNTH